MDTSIYHAANRHFGKCDFFQLCYRLLYCLYLDPGGVEEGELYSSSVYELNFLQFCSYDKTMKYRN